MCICTHHIIEQNALLQSMKMFCERFFKVTVFMYFIVFFPIMNENKKNMAFKSHIAEFNHGHCLSINNCHIIGAFKVIKVSKDAKIRYRYNQVPHLTKDTNGKVTYSQLDTTNESQEVSPFPAGNHKAHINRRAQRHSKHKTEKNIKDPQKKYRLGTVCKIFYWRA